MSKEDLISLLTDSIKDRDIKSLSDHLDKATKSLGKEQTHNILRIEVLLGLPTSTQEWFWRSSMSRKAYSHLTEKIYATVLKTLIIKGYVPGESFSSRLTQSGRRFLLVSKEVKSVILDSLPRERHSSLTLVVKVPKEEEKHECSTSSSTDFHQ